MIVDSTGSRWQIHGAPPWRFVVSRVLWALRAPGVFTFRAYGARFRLYPSSASASLWCNRRFYDDDAGVLREHLRPGDIFVDVGANIGVHSLIASGVVGSAGHVYTFEPHPRTFRFLRGNLRLNGAANVNVTNCAVGCERGTVRFTDVRSDDQNRVTTDGMAVDVHTLDALLPPARIRLLKIDTEGFELFVLRGATEVLKRTDIVFFECCGRHFSRFGYTVEDVFSLLRDYGFSIDLPDNFHPEGLYNLVAIAATKAMPCE
jgi:FkbM family methyltransferase